MAVEEYIIDEVLRESENNISLSKTVYGKNNAKKILDEEFTEFLLQTKNYKEFFNLYDSFFYNIPRSIHESFIYESRNYLNYPFSIGKGKIVEKLEDQLSFLQEQIDSIERHHPFFPNESVLANKNPSDNRKYLLQSNRKRLINSTKIFYTIKTRLKITKPNNEFILYLSIGGMNGILDGPPITTPNEIFIGNEIINTYNG